MRTAQSADVVIVGGGVAGGALAVQLARAGLETVVLEQQAQYTDRVRGETLALWGVAEAQPLGVLDVLSSAEGNWVSRSVPYDELVPAEVAEQRARDLGQFVPDVPAMLDLSHPGACEALAAGAADLGVAVQRGVSKVVITGGAQPSVAFRAGDRDQRVRCRLVVGADGRSSRVRRQAGIDWHSTPRRTFGWGLLVDGVEHWPTDAMSIGTHDDVVFFVLPRANGRVRLYLFHSADEPPRFTGDDAAPAFLDTFGGSAAYRSARRSRRRHPSAPAPASRCATHGPTSRTCREWCSSATPPATTTRSSGRG